MRNTPITEGWISLNLPPIEKDEDVLGGGNSLFPSAGRFKGKTVFTEGRMSSVAGAVVVVVISASDSKVAR